MYPLDEFEMASPSKRSRESLLEQGTSEIANNNKRRKVSPVTPEKADSSFDSDPTSNESKCTFSASKAAMRKEYEQLEEMHEEYKKYVPLSFTLDVETSLSNIDKVTDVAGLIKECNRSQEKSNILMKAMIDSLDETLEKNRRNRMPSWLVDPPPPPINAYLTVFSSDDSSDEEED